MNDEFEAEFSLPQKGHKVFQSSPDGAQLDVLGYTAFSEERSPLGRRGLYADGYKEAADLLVEESVDGMRRHRILYAIVFMYRHWLELALKGQVTYSYHVKLDWHTGDRESRLEKLTKCHDLETLWAELKQFLPHLSLELSVETTAAFDSYIKELAAHDEKGQAFRYPVTTGEKPTLRLLDVIDLPNLKARMNEMENYLSVVHEAIYEHLNPDDY